MENSVQVADHQSSRHLLYNSATIMKLSDGNTPHDVIVSPSLYVRYDRSI